MAKNNHNNDPLERLFRDKSNEFDMPFNAADWDDMESRLDQMDNLAQLNSQNSLMRKRFAAVAMLLLVLSGLAYIIFRNYNRINELEAKLRSQTIDTRPDQGKNEKMRQLTIPNNQNEISEDEPDKLLATGKQSYKAEIKQEAAINKNKDLYKIYKSTGLRSSNISVVKNLYDGVKQPNRTLIATVSNLSSGTNAFESAGLEENRTISNPLVYEANDTYNAYSGFAVGIAIAPDFSTAGSLGDFYTPGFKIGAKVEYNWNRNFAVSGGVIYSKVNYTASGNEYNPPAGFWGYQIIPSKITAACAILSIPIRVKYNFIHLNSSRFYVTAGVSSYIMLNEHYQFSYSANNTSNLIQSWNGQTGSRHWLSNATLSIGYEFDINPAISLRIEPYLNIPLRGVGWGSVELFSTGSFISINYHL